MQFPSVAAGVEPRSCAGMPYSGLHSPDVRAGGNRHRHQTVAKVVEAETPWQATGLLLDVAHRAFDEPDNMFGIRVVRQVNVPPTWK